MYVITIRHRYRQTTFDNNTALYVRASRGKNDNHKLAEKLTNNVRHSFSLFSVCRFERRRMSKTVFSTSTLYNQDEVFCNLYVLMISGTVLFLMAALIELNEAKRCM